MSRTDILFPVGRLVGGSLTTPQTTDAENKPLVYKSGPNVGQPRVDYYAAVAIEKGAEQTWAQTEWGAKIYAVALAAFPAHVQSPKFAWKVTDGDSTIPNSKGKKPCDREGYARHWVVSVSSGFAPKCFSAKGQSPVDAASIKLGHFVQVMGNVDGNGSQQQPGVFINHNMFAHAGFGPEISVGPDPTAVGFGQGAAPAGMTSVPVGVLPAPTPAAAAGPLPGMPAAPAAAGPSMPAPPAPVPTVPAPQVLAGPPAPAAGPVKTMTPKAHPWTYEQLLGAGWTDDKLVADGMLIIA